MTANHKSAHFDNVRERRAKRLEGVKPDKPGKAKAPKKEKVKDDS